jgi:UDP-N-acetylglucosamine 2-epimerase (non-hydrolysing)
MFCASETSVENLKKENQTKGVHFTGDVMYDLYKKLEDKFLYEKYEEFNLKKDNYILMTMHRDFNVDKKEKLEKISKQIEKISKETQIIFPIHPRTKKRIKEFGLEKHYEKVKTIEPLDYLNLMGLVKNSKKVITDSGGLQKEAYFAKKEAIVIMPDTGWRELTDIGWNKLANEENLYEKTVKETKIKYPEDIYGKGNAGELIVNKIIDYLGE